MATAPLYLTHFGLTDPPFRITPHPAFFYAGANRGETLDALLYAVTSGEGIVRVTGEVGSGKTMLCRMLIDRLADQVDIVYLANPSYARDEILYAIADELRLDLGGQRQGAVMRALQDRLIERYAAGRQVVVLVDEAHAMPAESLEEIRLLSNLENGHHKLLQMVLFGQPELNAILGQSAMRQLRERIVHSFELEPLRRGDVGQYLSFRMRAAGYKGPDNFSDAAVRMIATASQGLTRRINILADKSLLAAFADNAYRVEPRHARRAIEDSDFGGHRRFPLVSLWVGGALALGVACGVLLGMGLHPMPARLGAGPAVSQLPATTSALSDLSDHSEPSGKTRTDFPVSPNGAADESPVRQTARAVTKEAATSASPSSPPIAGMNAGSARVAAPQTLLQQRLQATSAGLEGAPAQQVSIQLLTVNADGRTDIDRYLRQSAGGVEGGQLFVYQVASSGRVGVLYGSFESRTAARAALDTLPASLRANGPILRTVGGIRAELADKPQAGGGVGRNGWQKSP